MNILNYKLRRNILFEFISSIELDMRYYIEQNNIDFSSFSEKIDERINKYNGVSLDSRIDFLDFSKCTKLVTVDCSDNKKITSLDFSNCSKLSKLTASDCTLTSINLSGCEELLELRLYSNSDLSSVDLSSCSKLYHLNAYNINVSYLNIANNPCLIEAYNAGVIQIGDSADEIHDSYSLNDKK